MSTRTDNGINRASGAAKRTMARRVSAWTMPATGVLAPERILVAVRAIAPVAGSPPNRGEIMLATPCPTSSTFGLCLSPLMRSETSADISDSIAPNMATVIAGEIRGRSRSRQVRDLEHWKSGWDATEARPNCFHWQFEYDDGRGPNKQCDDVTGDLLHENHE